jgi:hypothetical protein
MVTALVALAAMAALTSLALGQATPVYLPVRVSNRRK